MKIERLITIFDKKSEQLVQEINIDYIDLDLLKSILKPKEEDPLMYGIYEITLDNFGLINSILKAKIDYDFSKNYYYLECVQLPPYSFS